MARRVFVQNFPNFVKGGTVIGACTYQNQRPSSSFHREVDSDGSPSTSPSSEIRVPTPMKDEGEEGNLQCLRRHISDVEVEEASRILFSPEDNTTSSDDIAGGSHAVAPMSHASSKAVTTPLHPRPAVNAEILRFGMELARDPKIQDAVMEHLDSRWGLEGIDQAGGMGSPRDLGRRIRSLADEVSESMELVGGSFEMLRGGLHGEHDNTTTDEEWKDAGSSFGGSSLGGSGWDHMSQSFMQVGKNMRRKDTMAGEISEEVLDELLRPDDEDDVITQSMFAKTPDEKIRRYLRNLDFECIICHEYMVDATAVDCGEGHTFCRDCITRWLDEHESCPTCAESVRTLIPMRQYDNMIEKYVRASNLWDEITSYYKRKTLSQLSRDMARSRIDDDTCSASSSTTASSTTTTATGGGLRGAGRGVRQQQRRRTPWWKSESFHRALSVAAMIILAVLFKRAKP